MTDADPANVFACRCLNVRIRPQPAADGRVDVPANDSDYKSVFVGDEGVSTAYPQATLRTRSRGVPVVNTERCNRYVTLSCLLCQTMVYRVHQDIPVDIVGKEGPMLPTDNWAEQETLKSASGWIELHNGCLTGEAITTAEKSSSFSAIFSVVLPSLSSPSPEGQSVPSYTPASSSLPIHTPGNYLLNLRPIFPPPPFTPSHPAFVHLSAIAASKSEALRTDAEVYLAELVNKKVAEIEKTEAELRSHAEALWRGFREGVEKIEQDRNARTPLTRRKDSGNWQEAEMGSPQPSPALVSVRDFNPILSPRRPASPTSAPRMSSLSASLATSSFHHPKAQADRGRNSGSHEPSATGDSLCLSPPDLSDASSSLSSKGCSSVSSHLSEAMSIRANTDGSTYLEPFRRNMDQANDTATSFRFFTILEADTTRTRQKAKQQKTGETQGDVGHGTATNLDNEVTMEPEKSANGSKMEKSNGSRSGSRKARSKSGDRKTKKEANDISPKGKRKVTFDVKPDVVTIKDKENKEEDSERAGRASEEMIFDLEDEGSERRVSASNPLLPLNEPPHMPTRPSRTRVNSAGLPSSLSSLRPVSLPVPSATRPLRVPATTEDTAQAIGTSQILESSPRNRTKQTKSLSEDGESKDLEPLSSREAEILKLVAADAPSHRGAWKKDSKAWQLFVRRQGDKGHQSRGLIPEETEDDTYGKYADDDSEGDGDSDIQRGSPYQPTDIAASLPIAIGPLSLTKEPLSLASYQPKTALSGRSLQAHSKSGSRPVTSAALRKAAYAQRDRNRYADPGPLDFAAGEDDEDDEDDEAALASVDKGGRARQRALKILQIRSEVPASGMWRSLA